MGEMGKQVGLCYCNTAVAAAAAHITTIPIAPAATPPLPLSLLVVMLPLSAFVHACPTVRSGSPHLCTGPHLCSPLLIHARCH